MDNERRQRQNRPRGDRHPTAGSYGALDSEHTTVSREEQRPAPSSYLGYTHSSLPPAGARGYGGSLTQPGPPGQARPYSPQQWAEARPGQRQRSSPQEARRGAATREKQSGDEVRGLLEALKGSLALQVTGVYRYLYMSKWLSALEGFGGLARAYETAARENQVCAERFMERILELGGVPVQDLRVDKGLHHRQPHTLSTSNPAAVRRELQDSLTECEKALRHYTRLADQALGSDHITHKLAVSALETAVRLRRSLRGHLG